VSGTSPDRMDALVWALTELTGGAGQGAAFLAAMKQRAETDGLTVATSARDWRTRIPTNGKAA
jgi:hypothetical protein